VAFIAYKTGGRRRKKKNDEKDFFLLGNPMSCPYDFGSEIGPKKLFGRTFLGLPLWSFWGTFARLEM